MRRNRMPNRYCAVASACLILLLAGCVHRTPYRDPLFFETLGHETELMVTIRVDQAAGLVTYVLDSGQLGNADYLISRAERVSVAARTLPDAEGPAFYGGIEGNFSKLFMGLGLRVSGDWERQRDGFVFYESTATGFEVAIPKSGIILFSDGFMGDVYSRMTSERVIYVPGEVSKQLEEAEIAFYASRPDGMNLIGDRVSLPFALYFDELWVMVNRVTGIEEEIKPLYWIDGVITLPEDVQARVFDRVIRLLYQDYMNKQQMSVDNWRRTILKRDHTVVFDKLLVYEDLIIDLIRTAAGLP